MTTLDDLGRRLARLEKQLGTQQRASRLGSASLDDTALTVNGPDGNLRGILGQQADGTTAVNIVNGGPPPAPSTPTVAPALGGISITWDGKFAGDAVIPLDWSRIEVHASPTNGFTPGPDTVRATIETPQGAIVYLPATAPQYVVLLARNTSGTGSAPTGQVGPYAPRTIVDTDVADGSITETKIATDAVTTPKIKAGAVQTAELDALAVTTAKLAAGAVDATAIKADAITGKDITGGTVNGAVVTGGTIQTSDTDPSLVITGSDGYMRVYDDAGNTTFQAGGSDGTVKSPSSTGLTSDLSIVNGIAAFGYTDGTNVAAQILGELGGNSIQLNGGYPDDGSHAGTRLRLVHGASTGTSGRATAFLDSPHAADHRADLSVTGAITGDSLTTTGDITVGGTTYTTYTPTVSNGGSATFTSRTGWYKKFGKMVFFGAQVIVNAAGSGTGNVMITAPSSIERTIRQTVPATGDGLFATGVLGTGSAVAITTGSGATFDRIRLPGNAAANSDSNLLGSHLLAGSALTVQGWYREA